MKVIVMLSVLAFASCASRAYVEQDQSAWENCKNVLLQQAEAWNRGELEIFVLGYRRSPETIWISDDEVRLGFEAMLARYKESYPDSKSMGRLGFESLEFMNIDSDHIMCSGTWVLSSRSGEEGQEESREEERWGRFGLIFRKEQGAWKVAVDYTTKGVGTRPVGKVEDR